MIICQRKYKSATGVWTSVRDTTYDRDSFQLVLVFGSPDLIVRHDLIHPIQQEFSKAIVLVNSTAGEIMDTAVEDNSLSVTALSFERTTLEHAFIDLEPNESGYDAGRRLARQISTPHLKNLLVISDGQHVNGSELVNGLQTSLPEGVMITGGLAGDGVAFRKTYVGLNCIPRENCIAAIGFYGNSLTVRSSSVGGWDPFGPQRLITRSKGNILYELDGQPALDIYKKYLGEYAKDLPSTGLLFPLSIRNGGKTPIVRTILAVNDTDNSLVFAGNMPEGYYARLMKAGVDRLIEGAGQAAQDTYEQNNRTAPDLALLISCVGRKLVLNERVEEEVEVIRQVYGDTTALTGFYSYGEISPSYNSAGPELHNQTMTITTFTEHVS